MLCPMVHVLPAQLNKIRAVNAVLWRGAPAGAARWMFRADARGALGRFWAFGGRGLTLRAGSGWRISSRSAELAMRLSSCMNGGFLRFIGLPAPARRTVVVERWAQNGRNSLFLVVSRLMGDLTALGHSKAIVTLKAGWLARVCPALAPLRAAILSPLSVAFVWLEIGKPFAKLATIQPCLVISETGKDGGEIPTILMGSGVWATQCAGVNNQSWCRPKYSDALRWVGGVGMEWSQSCANGVNNRLRLNAGLAHVN